MTTTSVILPRMEIPQAESPTSACDESPPADVGTMLKTGNLPTRVTPAVSRWMTWSFIALVFALPLTQTVVELRRGVRPTVLELFLRTPTRTNLRQFEKRLEDSSVVKKFVQPRVQQMIAACLQRKPERETAGTRTPFIEWLAVKKVDYILHPFIGHTQNDRLATDYFGFRNANTRSYFDRPEGKLIVLTGNSEARGVCHERSIAQRLEAKLNQRSHEKWHVLNLGASGYTLPYEIATYVFLAYHLKPEYVISHSFFSDPLFGLRVPREFQTLGLNYTPQVEKLYLQAHNVTPFDGAADPRDAMPDCGLVDAYLRNVEKYRTIVQSNRGHFILGVQPFKDIPSQFDYPSERTVVLSAYKELLAKLPSHSLDHIDFTRVPNIVFADRVHTNDAGAEIVAEIYCGHILGHAASAGNESPVSPINAPMHD